ncbi:MAG TPA: DUF2380 domain-containing protein [Acetobacteraceae bacterium]|nr:DUF2380 domain-containing protein [Acetobacteraceae bacterium]
MKRWVWAALGVLGIWVVAQPWPAQAAAPEPTAVFPFQLVDTSGEPPGENHAPALAAATATLKSLLQKSGHYELVSLKPFAAQVASEQRDKCGECWVPVARKAGARYAVVPFVHKVSTLISTMDIWIADLETMRYVVHMQGQLRGDTREAYVRGVTFLVGDQLGGRSG